MKTKEQLAAEYHEVMAVIGAPKPGPRKKTHMRRPKSERKVWTDRLDKIVREIVLARDEFCVLTGHHAGAAQCGHLITRAKLHTRWDLTNCNCQCAGCNLKHEFYPETYTLWWLNYFGRDEYVRLNREAESTVKYTIDELETMFIELTEIQKRQQNEPQWKPYFTQAEILSGSWRGA